MKLGFPCIVLTIATSAVLLAGCGDLGSAPNIQPDDNSSGGSADGASSHRVVYDVSGTADSVDITFSNDGMGSSSQENGVEIPWKKTMTIPSQGLDTYSLLPQNKGESGKVTCKITVDGKPLARQTSSGAYAITTCTATLGG